MTPEDILRKGFARAPGGYRRSDVREYLAVLALEVERLRAAARRDDRITPPATPPPEAALTPPTQADEPQLDPRSGRPRREPPPKLRAIDATDPMAVARSIPDELVGTPVVTLEVRGGESSLVAAPDEVTTVVVDHDTYCVSVYRGQRLVATEQVQAQDAEPPAAPGRDERTA